MATESLELEQMRKDALKSFNKNLEMLYGIAIELIEDRNGGGLLSPVLRGVLLEKAKLVKEEHQRLGLYLLLDDTYRHRKSSDD